MSFSLAETDAEDDDTVLRTAAFDRGRGDRMRGDGRDLMMQLVLQAITAHEERLTGINKMKFAAAMEESIRNLISAFTVNEERKERLPL